MTLSNRTAAIALAATLTAPLAVAIPELGAAPQAQAATTIATTETSTTETSTTPSKRASRAAAREALSDRTMALAAKHKGVPYRRGGTTPRGFDCSGFTRFVYDKLHKRIPRTSQQQFNAARRVKHPRVGDLIFYHSSRSGSVYHVAIYAGHRKVWHSTRPGERVRKTGISARHWTAGRY